MAEQKLEGAQIHPRFPQVCGEGVTTMPHAA
jgi:hypothetical protein